MVEVGDHCGSQGDRKFYIRVKVYIWGMHMPCSHGCHRILPNCQLAAPAAARERLRPLGNPYISRREIARRFQPSHRRRPFFGSELSYSCERTQPGIALVVPGRSLVRLYGGYCKEN